MADEKTLIKGDDILLSVEVDEEWKKVGCSNADGFTMDTDSDEVSTKCNAGFSSSTPGDNSWSFSNTYYPFEEENSDFITTTELLEMQKDKEINKWKFESINEDFDLYIEGEGYITSQNIAADSGETVQNDIEITGTGEPIFEEEA